MANGETHRTGYSKSEAEVAVAYNWLAIKHHGAFAVLNVIPAYIAGSLFVHPPGTQLGHIWRDDA
jgi:hypothetical protein